MAVNYIVDYTDTSKTGITINSGALDNTTSLILLGHNSQNYGETVAESFLHLLENFAGNAAPRGPIEGQIWFNNTTDLMQYYDSANWKSVGVITTQADAPTLGNVDGHFWLDSDNSRLQVYNGGWVDVGGGIAGTQLVSRTRNIGGSDENTLEFLANDQLIAIISSVAGAIDATETIDPVDNTTPFLSTILDGDIHTGINFVGTHKINLTNNTTSELTEGSNLYFTDARVTAALNSITLPTDLLSVFDTDDLTEGSNLYFTPERVDDRVNALVNAGPGITVTYDDNANTLTISNSAVGTVSANPINQSTDETGYNALDSINSIRISGTNYRILSLETLMDELGGSRLVGGTDVTLDYDDANGTLTINSSGGGGSSATLITATNAQSNSHTTASLISGQRLNDAVSEERVFDHVKNILIDGTGVSLTDNDSTNRITVTNTSTVDSGSAIRLDDGTSDSGGRIVFGNSSDAKLFYRGAGNTLDIELETPAAAFRITDNGTARFTFTKSNGNLTATGEITTYSDERLKTNIQTITNASTIISQLRGVSYDRTDIESSSIGVVAQELQAVLPDLISESDGYLSVSYGNMAGLFIEALKEYKLRIEYLEDEIRNLRYGD